jgi:hypothetical protein
MVRHRWRRIPDPIVDDYLSTLPSTILNPSYDQLSLLLTLSGHASASSCSTPLNEKLQDVLPSSAAKSAARKLVEELVKPPPEGVRADDTEIEDAQECFHRFAGGLLLGVSARRG